MALMVDEDSFGPTGNMKRRELVNLIRLPRSHRRFRWPAFWWRLYPPGIVKIHRRRLRRSVRPKQQ